MKPANLYLFFKDGIRVKSFMAFRPWVSYNFRKSAPCIYCLSIVTYTRIWVIGFLRVFRITYQNVIFTYVTWLSRVCNQNSEILCLGLLVYASFVHLKLSFLWINLKLCLIHCSFTHSYCQLHTHIKLYTLRKPGELSYIHFRAQH